MKKTSDDKAMRLHFISLGCPKNLVDSEVMLAALTGSGYELVDDPAGAGIIVVNTCAFIEDAKKEAIDTILEMAEHKRKGSCRLLVVAGCLPQRYEEEISGLFPEVDIFIGTGEFARILEIIAGWSGEQTIEVARSTYIYDDSTPRMHTTARHIGYIKIAEGCLHPCSFCIIPRIRGNFRSRPVDSIIEEARAMIGRGVKEIDLIAQDTTSYGKDLKGSLAALLEGLTLIEGEKWIRLMYAYPHEFPEAVIAMIRDISDICAYVDLPIQHASDRILKMMKRKGNVEETRGFIEFLRYEIPEISVRTSLIVGFPGETDREFDELLDFIGEMKFEHLGAFIYSPEEGTPAAKLKNRVARPIAEARLSELMDLQREISLGNNRRYLGKRIRVLVDGPSKETDMLLAARHEGQAPGIDGVVYIADGIAAAGDFATVEISEAHEYDLVGRIVP